ncbi:alpha/beta fold hydrolase [Streptomyces sp. CBMA156]|uniref:alpha/beta fold hydrolase n=1 Tax=Streptomyces sp. CBMA156 TaxID=1930280 RepID=UPI001661F93E|nr:alpha/beta hydrolase [Streptomyces sp. CBMA156]
MSTRQGRRGTPVGPDLRGVQEVMARALGENLPGGVRTGELDRGGRALRWVEAGRGGVAPVVLIASCGTTALTWSAVLPELARHGRVVAYDRAGLGASDPESGPGRGAGPTPDGQVADLAALVRHLDAGPALLVGHSWGAQPAQLLAWQRPDLVAGLVLVDPAHEEFQPKSIRAAEAVLNRLWLHRAGSAPAAPGSAEPLDLAEAAVIAYPHQRWAVLAEQRMTALAGPGIRRRRSLARPPEMPLAVLSATEGLPRAMRVRWTAVQACVARNAVRGTHGTVHGAGHAIQADRPQAVVAAVREVSEHARYFLKV